MAGQAFYLAQVERARRLRDDELAAEIASVANDLNEAKRLAEPLESAEIERGVGIRDAEVENRANARRLVDPLERRLLALEAVAAERARARSNQR